MAKKRQFVILIALLAVVAIVIWRIFFATPRAGLNITEESAQQRPEVKVTFRAPEELPQMPEPNKLVKAVIPAITPEQVAAKRMDSFVGIAGQAYDEIQKFKKLTDSVLIASTKENLLDFVGQIRSRLPKAEQDSAAEFFNNACDDLEKLVNAIADKATSQTIQNLEQSYQANMIMVKTKLAEMAK
jgi:hypothetical protein